MYRKCLNCLNYASSETSIIGEKSQKTEPFVETITQSVSEFLENIEKKEKNKIKKKRYPVKKLRSNKKAMKTRSSKIETHRQ